MVLRTERFQPFEQRPCGFPIRLPGSRRQNRKRQQLEMRYLPDAYSDDTEEPRPQPPGFPKATSVSTPGKAIDGWYLPGEDKVRTSAMMVGDPNRPPFGKLVKRPIPQWKNHGLQDYVKVETVGDTLYCELPYNAQITPWLEVVSATGGDTIRIQTDNDDNNGNGSAPSVRSEYITTPRQPAIRKSRVDISYRQICDSQRRGGQSREVPGETGCDTEFAGAFRMMNDPFNERTLEACSPVRCTCRLARRLLLIVPSVNGRNGGAMP